MTGIPGQGTKIKYLGWSNIIIKTDQGDLAFDPYFRKTAGMKWADLDDYAGVKAVCVSHGHAEHFLDAHRVVKKFRADVISSPLVCGRMERQFNVPRELIHPLEVGPTLETAGFKVSAFEWVHRRINYLKFLGGDFITGAKFSLINILTCPTTGPYYGFVVRAPDGLTIMNLTEGTNNFLPLGEIRAVAQQYSPTVLVAGMQLAYEQDVARAVEAVGPEQLIMYHPHQALFARMGIQSSPPEAFRAAVEKLNPGVEIITPRPGEEIELG